MHCCIYCSDPVEEQQTGQLDAQSFCVKVAYFFDMPVLLTGFLKGKLLSCLSVLAMHEQHL